MSRRSSDIKLMIMDACVLIDFIKADRYVLELITRHIGPVYVVSPVADEVYDINEGDLHELGLIIVEPALADAFSAAAGVGRTSFQDRLCLLTARRHGFTCVTNDKILRRECKGAGVETLWGLQLLLLLQKNGCIPTEDAIQTADRIHENNPKHITKEIIRRFKDKLGKYRLSDN